MQDLMDSNRYQNANRYQRLINVIIDIFLCSSVYILLLIWSETEIYKTPILKGLIRDSEILLFIIISSVYYLVLESLIGKTVGKMITKTMVVNKFDSNPSMAECLGRTLFRYIPFEWISYLFNSNPVGWHDKFSGTKVVKETTPLP